MKKTLLAFLAFALCCVLFEGPEAMAENENICFGFPSLEGAKSAQLDLTCTVSNADSLLALDARITYPSDKLSALAVAKTTYSNTMSMACNLDTPGLILVGMAGATGLTGAGDLFSVTFELTGEPGDTATIVLEQVKVNDILRMGCIENGRIAIEDPNAPVKGDMDKDGQITPGDALCVLQAYVGICPTSCGACEELETDLDGDQTTTPADALCVLQKFVGLPSCLD